MGGNRRHRPHSRHRAIGAALASLSLAAGLAACGSSSGTQEPTGNFPVKIVKAEFPTSQSVGQTSLLRIGVRNTGDRTMPTVAISLSIGGEEGEASSLPFGIRDPQPELAQPDRPVWVLEEGWPRVGDSTEPAGASGLSHKTFDFGSLKAGGEVEAVWKLSAVKPGKWTVIYTVDAGVTGSARAQTAAGTKPGGTFSVDVSQRTPEVEVTDSGEVVEIEQGKGKAGGEGGSGSGEAEGRKSPAQ